MNILLTILIVVAGLVAVILIVALFAKNDYSLEREIVINKPHTEVFDYLRYLKNHDHFNKWIMVDPAMKKSYKGVDGTVGFIYAWNGNKKAGEGEQEIIRIKQDERVDIEIRFVRPFKGLAYAPFVIESLSASQTRVKWGMSSKMKYPMNIILLFIDMDKVLGSDVEFSLNTLKNILEKN
jgi:hypothetical protein